MKAFAFALWFVAAPSVANTAPLCDSSEAVIDSYVRASTSGRAEEVANLFAADGQVHGLPQTLGQLNGALSLDLSAQRPDGRTAGYFVAALPRYVRLLDSASLDDLVFVKVQVADAQRANTQPYELAAFRVTECRISDLWRIAQTAAVAATGEDDNARVARALVAANNAGDVEGYLSKYAPNVQRFRDSGNPRALADRPSRYNADPDGRRTAERKSFASGPPAQVTLIKLLTVGPFVLARGVSRLREGQTIDEASIYRIDGGKISHDWFIAARPRA